MKLRLCFMLLLLCLAVPLFLTGCNGYNKTTYYYKDGKIDRKVVEEETTPVQQVTKSTQNKAVVYWRNGWGIGIIASVVTPDNPLPNVKIEAFNSDGGFGTFPKEMNAIDIAKIIMSTRTDLEINENGVKNSPPKTDDIKGAALDGDTASVVPSEPG